MQENQSKMIEKNTSAPMMGQEGGRTAHDVAAEGSWTSPGLIIISYYHYYSDISSGSCVTSSNQMTSSDHKGAAAD